MPKYNLMGSMIAPPQSDHYSLVGTAFDYLMRFYLNYLNPKANTQKWVAEDAVKLIEDAEYHQKAVGIINDSKTNYDKYLLNGILSTDLIVNCLQLAQLDAVYRAGYLEPNLGMVDARDISDLTNLLEVAKQRDFRAKKICVLNPTFGKASNLVGGADMDVLMDGTLIDIKTTKFLGMKRDYYHQLIGYYILSKIGGIHGVTEANIENLGVYYSRHGILHEISVEEAIGSCDLESFIHWFIARAVEEFPTVTQ